MKKLFMLSTVAFLLTGAAFANEGEGKKKSCDKDKKESCCKKDKSAKKCCKKDKKEDKVEEKKAA
jgi:hypothetical protein